MYIECFQIVLEKTAMQFSKYSIIMLSFLYGSTILPKIKVSNKRKFSDCFRKNCNAIF
jgi:hypothetical protein